MVHAQGAAVGSVALTLEVCCMSHICWFSCASTKVLATHNRTVNSHISVLHHFVVASFSLALVPEAHPLPPNRAMHGSRTPAILFSTWFPSFRAANFDSQPTFLLLGASILDRTVISILSQCCQLKDRVPHSVKSGNHELRYTMQHSADYCSRHFLAIQGRRKNENSFAPAQAPAQ